MRIQLIDRAIGERELREKEVTVDVQISRNAAPTGT